MKEDFLESFDELLHNYIAEEVFEDVTLDQRLMHIDGHEYEIHLSIIRK